ncbi:FtsX-like permease family protein [Candidatus Uhrbacteria bacterium]|nr:FtsX-like permease family protein [Candidatus Uhrbacteria bacterium]
MTIHINSWRIIVAAWKHFVRNIWLSLTTVFVLFLAILSVNVLVGVNALLMNAVSLLENKVDVSVYFKADTAQGVLDQAKFFVMGLPQVRSAELVSADQALDAFKKRHAGDDTTLSALNEIDGNPLGATLIVKAKRTSDYTFLLEALQNPQFNFAIESKNFESHEDAIQRVRLIGQSVRSFGVGLIAVFAAFSVLIVFNTIRVAIYTQREEIGVMRLVGASNAFVRWPFVIEGLFLAGLALFAATAIVAVSVTWLEPHINPFFDGQAGLVEYFMVHAQQLLLIQGLGLGVLVALSSWAAVGRYLKK